ncbi:MAG: N-6 DNA methylase [Zoogloeaceae bacterium]|nr:N-6 DNA methylase [Zoogloeaceae bacterium]
MLQDIRLQTSEQNQFLGDLFEGFLDRGVKQSEGQFFTPTPIVRFLISALPLENIIARSPTPPRVIDYACGAGHFLNEYCHQIFPFVRKTAPKNEDNVELITPDLFKPYYAAVTGIEKEYRLSKVSKVSASMYGQGGIRIIYADALAAHPNVQDGTFDVLVANPPYSVKGFLETLTEADRARYDLFSASADLAKNNAIETFFVERAKQLLAPGGVAALILPSSILSNTGIYTAMREILLKYFDIVAIAEFGSGTFGKTGTNTATLFLRRKATKPDLAEHYQNRVEAWFEGDFSVDGEFEDTQLLAAYCAKTNLPLDDYKTLLDGSPSAALLGTEIFKEYRKTFDASTEAKNIQKKKLTAKYTAANRTAELEKAHLAYLREIEGEKLYYYLLAADNPLPVVLIKSPADNKTIKTFLGYEWSSRKGNEGIKYIVGGASSAPKREEEDSDDEELLVINKGVSQIRTPLFNPADLADAEKINSVIRAAFNGETPPIPDSLSAFVTRAALVDMLDFTRPAFDKAFKTTAPTSNSINLLKNKNLTIFSLSNETEFDISIGQRVVETELESDGRVPVYSANVFEPVGHFSKLLLTDFSAPSVLWGIDGDWMVNFIPAGQPFYPTDHCGVLRVRTDKINPYYLAYALEIEGKNQRFSRTLRASTGRIKSIRLGFPSKLEQDRIVSECEAVDAECETARQTIEEAKAKIAEFIAKQKAANQLSLAQIGNFVSERTDAVELTAQNYVGVDNILPDTQGKRDSDFVPSGGTATQYQPKDILLSNIRPYLKKIWFADCDGGSSNDVLVFRVSTETALPEFVFQVLKQDAFFDYEMQTVKGMKMPRGDKKHILSYKIPVPPLAEQTRIVAEIEQHETTITAARAHLAAAPAHKRAILEKWL